MLAEYDDDTIAACRSVLLEVLTILGKQREHLVVVGGWVPALLFGAAHRPARLARPAHLAGCAA